MRSSIKKHLVVPKDKRKQYYASKTEVKCLISKCDIDETSKIPLATICLESRRFSKKSSLSKALLHIIKSLQPIEICNTYGDLSLGLTHNRLAIAIKNRRGAGNYIILNTKTYKKLNETVKLLFNKDPRITFELYDGITDNMILIMYHNSNKSSTYTYDHVIFKKFMFSRSVCVVDDLIPLNCKLIEVV